MIETGCGVGAQTVSLAHNIQGEPVEVLWPHGKVDVLQDVATNQVVTIRKGRHL